MKSWQLWIQRIIRVGEAAIQVVLALVAMAWSILEQTTVAHSLRPHQRHLSPHIVWRITAPGILRLQRRPSERPRCTMKLRRTC